MKKSPSPLGKRVKGYSKELIELKEMIIAFIFIFLVFSFCYFIENYQLGYAYYNENLNIIGVVHQEIFLDDVKQSYLQQLAADNFNVIETKTPDLIIKSKIIRKNQNESGEISQYYIDNTKVNIEIWQVTTNDDLLSYYFKSQTDCDNFTKECKKYLAKDEYIITKISGDKNMITSQEILNEKLTKIKEYRKATTIERTKTTPVSRGGVRRYNAPMASYVYMSSPYGMRNGSMHTGIDFAAAAGTELYAWKDGTVSYSGWYGNYGYFIAIDHSDGTISRYAHCSKINVEMGESITQGATIGYVGNTGRSTGSHLHFEILVNGNFVNPANYL